MESSIALQSFNCKFNGQSLTVGRRLISSPLRRNVLLISCVKTPEVSVASAAKSDGAASTGSSERTSIPSATFPNGFEALVPEVCDETEIAELKMKVGNFDMHVRQNHFHSALSHFMKWVPKSAMIKRKSHINWNKKWDDNKDLMQIVRDKIKANLLQVI